MKFIPAKVAAGFFAVVVGLSAGLSPSVATNNTGQNYDPAILEPEIEAIEPVTLDLKSEEMPAELAPRLPSEGVKVFNKAAELPSGVDLEVGESLLVSYADGEVLFEQVALACTTSSSVTKPKIIPIPKTNGQTSSAHSYGKSSGCSGTSTIRFMQELGSTPKGTQQYSVSPGTTVNKSVAVSCTSKVTKNWKALNYLVETDAGATVSQSPTVSLLCNA